MSEQDQWLGKFLRGIGEEFFASLANLGFSAVICPSLSAYHGVEHRVWLDNRSLIQQFMSALLERGLPAIFFTYLEDTPEHQDWLKEYLQVNSRQSFIATGFDHNFSGRHLKRRIELLAEVQSAVGRPLSIVLNCVLTRLPDIHFASSLFPGRVHLVGQSVFQRSVQGSALSLSSSGLLSWLEKDVTFRRGLELFLHNAEVLESAIISQVPDFYHAEAA